MVEKVNLEELARFLVNAKRNTYASESVIKIDPERPGFDEVEYEEGNLYYRDSWCGFFQAPGMEVVRLGGRDGKLIWAMVYSGGMLEEFHGNVDLARQCFTFLKKALAEVPLEMPFRGPTKFTKDDWKWLYTCRVDGDIKRFSGIETILYGEDKVFVQYFGGGLVVDK